MLADLQGPKIRIEKFLAGPVILKAGDAFALDCRAEAPPGDATRIGVSYLGLNNDVKPGDTLLLDDGLIALKVDKIDGTTIHTTVAIGGALSDRKGINRAGYFVMPMDETLAVVAIDLGGRPHAHVDLKVKVRMVGDLQSELVHDFFDGFAMGARANVHAKVLYGRSSHHHIEAVFKAFARALRVACAKDRRLARMLPSTKGLL